MGYPEQIPFIGSKYESEPHRLMFVGIETYGNPERTSLDTDYEKSRFKTELIEEYFKEKKKPFWRWVNEISTSVINSKDEDYVLSCIAYTNLHKCEVRLSDMDSSNYELDDMSFENCIRNQGWIFKEIEELKPKNVIVFAGRKDEGRLAKLFLGNEKLFSNFNYSKYSDLTSKQLERWKNDVFIHLRDGDRRFIITNHPQGTSKIIRSKIIDLILDPNSIGEAKKWKMR